MPDICTSNGDSGAGIDAERILERVRMGLLPVPRSVVHRELASADESEIAAFRATCPPSSDDAAVELEIALRLLEEPELFKRAIGAAEPATTQALAGPHAPGAQAH